MMNTLQAQSRPSRMVNPGRLPEAGHWVAEDVARIEEVKVALRTREWCWW